MSVEIRRITIETAYLNVLVYGSPGVGKTTLAATAQDHVATSPVLIASAESGNLSIAGRGDIDEAVITEMKDLEELAWLIAHGDKRISAYKSIVLDSGTELATMALQEAVDRDRKKKGTTETRTSDEIEIQNYGVSQNQMRRLTRMFRDLPVHFIMTALPKYTYARNVRVQADTEPVNVTPEFSPKLAQSIMAYVDHVWYLYADDDSTRSILTRERGVFFAKTRGEHFAEALGEVFHIPTIPALYDLLLSTEGSRKEISVPKATKVAS